MTALCVNKKSGHIQRRCGPVVSKENNAIKHLLWPQPLTMINSRNRKEPADIGFRGL